MIRQLLLGRLGAGDSPMLIGGTTFILLEGLLRASGVLIFVLDLTEEASKSAS